MIKPMVIIAVFMGSPFFVDRFVARKSPVTFPGNHLSQEFRREEVGLLLGAMVRWPLAQKTST